MAVAVMVMGRGVAARAAAWAVAVKAADEGAA